MKKISKTNVCRILDSKKIKYEFVVREEDKEFDFVDNQDFIKKTLEKLTEVEKQIILGRYFEQKNESSKRRRANQIGIRLYIDEEAGRIAFR